MKLIDYDSMLSKIIETCENLKDNISIDDIPKDYYFELKYEDKLIVSLVNIYEYHDEHYRVKHKSIYGKMSELNINLKEYCNLLINIYEWKLMIGTTGNIRTEEILKRIKILKIN